MTLLPGWRSIEFDRIPENLRPAKGEKMKRKTTLCMTCEFGLVREWEDWLDDPPPMNGIEAKCLLTNDFVEAITSCNKYKKTKTKVTYHDPDFQEYEKEVLQEDA